MAADGGMAAFDFARDGALAIRDPLEGVTTWLGFVFVAFMAPFTKVICVEEDELVPTMVKSLRGGSWGSGVPPRPSPTTVR